MQRTKTNPGRGHGWVVWFVGLPGSGKSSIAESVQEDLQDRGVLVRLLQMDKQRRVYFPKPRYTAKERTKAYELFAEDAASTAASGLNVIMDGSAPKLAMREYARSLVPYFAEVYIQCSLEVAMRRESQRQGGQVMADLYQKALDRQQTGRAVEGLGQVIGVDVPFEDNPLAECRVDNDLLSLQEAKEEVLRFLEPWRLALETG